MKIKVENPNNVPMAVIVDKHTRASEVIESEYVSIATFLINQVNHIMQLTLVWGGYDSKGQWHVDHSRQVASISISGDRPEEAELYKRLALDDGKYSCCFDEAFFKRLLKDENAIQVVNDRVWGFVDCCVFVDESIIFHKIGGIVQPTSPGNIKASPSPNPFTPYDIVYKNADAKSANADGFINPFSPPAAKTVFD